MTWGLKKTAALIIGIYLLFLCRFAVLGCHIQRIG